MLKTLNENQALILSNVEISTGTITSILKEISEKYGVSISTLKLNARILKELNLMSYGTSSHPRNVEITELGRFVLSLIKNHCIKGASKTKEESPNELPLAESAVGGGQRTLKSEKQVVVKFGGSVLEGGSAILRAAEAIRRESSLGHKILVVASAMKGTTDKLLSMAKTISPDISTEATDHIITLGEEESVRLMTAALRSLGLDAVEVTPNSVYWPIVTDETFGDANPLLDECKKRTEEKIMPLLREGKIPVVCGFVGRSFSGKTTTIGRGGSDTTAVLLANCLGADELVLVKDVAGIYSADPNKVLDAKPIEDLESEEAYILSSSGAKVLHSKVFKYKPVELKIRIVSNNGKLTEGGTVIHGTLPDIQVETHRKPVTMITIVGDVTSNPEALAKISQKIKEKEGKILSLTADERATVFYIEGKSTEVLRGVHTLISPTTYLKAISEYEDLALITVKGSGLEVMPGMIEKITGPLAKKNINIYGLLTIHNSIGVLVNWEREQEALTYIKEVLGVV